MAVVSVLALTQPSEAKTVYTPADVVLSCSFIYCDLRYNLDLNHDGVTDFTITVTHSVRDICNMFSMVGELPASGNGAVGGKMGIPPVANAAALMRGAPIGQGQQFQGGGGTMAFSEVVGCLSKHGGPWFNVTEPRYLGLSFQRNGRTHYGWARLTVQGPLYAKLTGYAYETIPGKSIKAGQKKEATDEVREEDFGPDPSLTNPVPDTPQPTSLAMLALGAQGVPLWRRKESLQGNLKGTL